MIGVVVRDEDVAQPPAFFRERAPDGAGVRCVDGRSETGIAIVDEDAEVIAAANELMDIQPAYRSLRSCLAAPYLVFWRPV